jgi:hypothetical protein
VVEVERKEVAVEAVAVEIGGGHATGEAYVVEDLGHDFIVGAGALLDHEVSISAVNGAWRFRWANGRVVDGEQFDRGSASDDDGEKTTMQTTKRADRCRINKRHSKQQQRVNEMLKNATNSANAFDSNKDTSMPFVWMFTMLMTMMAPTRATPKAMIGVEHTIKLRDNADLRKVHASWRRMVPQQYETLQDEVQRWIRDGVASQRHAIVHEQRTNCRAQVRH